MQEAQNTENKTFIGISHACMYHCLSTFLDLCFSYFLYFHCCKTKQAVKVYKFQGVSSVHDKTFHIPALFKEIKDLHKSY